MLLPLLRISPFTTAGEQLSHLDGEKDPAAGGQTDRQVTRGDQSDHRAKLQDLASQTLNEYGLLWNLAGA
jgi:hypothetical protein